MPSDQLYSLPLEQQIGQFFFIGLSGTELDEEARELIEEIKPAASFVWQECGSCRSSAQAAG